MVKHLIGFPDTVAACPACAEGESRVWFSRCPAAYRRCLACKTVFAALRAAPELQQQELVDTYSLSPETFQLAASRQAALQHIAQVIQLLKPAGALLDIGCSTGDFFRYFLPETWQRFGVEPARTTAQYAACNSGARVFGDLQDLSSYPAGSFDVITMLDMVYHLHDPFQEFRLARRLLASHGILGVELAGQSYMLARSRGILCQILDGRWSRIDPGSIYLNWFSILGLERLLHRSGFQVIQKVAIPPASVDGFSGRVFQGYINAVHFLAGNYPVFLPWVPKILFLAVPSGEYASES